MDTKRTEIKEDADIKKHGAQYKKVLEELRETPIHALNPVTVHYVNRTVEGQYSIPFHGYTAVESMPRSLKIEGLPNKAYPLKKKYAEVFYLGTDWTHIPFYVSAEFLEAVNKSSGITDETKKALSQMAGKKFPFVENFLRALLEKIAPNWVNLLARDPRRVIWKLENKKQIALCGELINLISLNEDCNLFVPPFLPFERSTHFCGEDREAFEQGACISTPYSLINPTAVYELFHQQFIFRDYLEEKAGLGESANKSEAKNTDQILKRLVLYSHTPSANNPFSTNCNKTTATFLQEAEHISIKQEYRQTTTVTGASLFSIGSGQRMFFWGSKRQQAVVDLFISHEPNKKDLVRASKLIKNETLRNQLAQDKYYILEVIDTWPVEQQLMALEQIQNPNTPLGVVFSTPTNPLSFLPTALTLPNKSRGILKIATERLETLRKNLPETHPKFLKTQPSPK